MEAQHILVSGAGIGGLTAALCLAQAGHRVEVFEQAEILAEVGAGIQLSANGMRVLHHLGLLPRIAALSFLPEGVEMRDWRSGQMIASTTLGAQAQSRFGFPYYHIHRADLISVLLQGIGENANIQLHMDSAVEHFSQTGSQVSVAVNSQIHVADMLVGADGIHSRIRTGLFGAEAPTFTGNVAWRGLVPASLLPQDLVRPVATAWWGPGKHFVHYFVRQGELVNCVCVVEKSGWDTESWAARGDLQELQADFAGWHGTIQTLIEHMDPQECYKWALFDRPPMSQWGRGRVTLLGDACHPTLPFMAQGAVMAIEDGAVLAQCLATEGSVAAALGRYENIRRKRTAAIQRGSRRNARVFHLGGLQARLRNSAAKFASSAMMDSIYSHDVFAEFGSA
ncbi:MAG: FAD-dependent monooxygenase [SAR86 cluster bacterium]|uniref:FAD-dependent monooxygenase n=1 Tax=SAR86 cluster bacterium TaxID=2030880 RepID=A0A972VV63_9GAMM|nr:FAD-dependent monooxygenase [SAR86 cluster bacterium]